MMNEEVSYGTVLCTRSLEKKNDDEIARKSLPSIQALGAHIFQLSVKVELTDSLPGSQRFINFNLFVDIRRLRRITVLTCTVIKGKSNLRRLTFSLSCFFYCFADQIFTQGILWLTNNQPWDMDIYPTLRWYYHTMRRWVGHKEPRCGVNHISHGWLLDK